VDTTKSPRPALAQVSPGWQPASVVRTALTALKSRLIKARPVALRDMDALCIKGWSKMWSKI
jgi:hypothetical protein